MHKMETKYDLLNQLYEDKRIKKSPTAIFQYLVHKGDAKRCYVSLKTIQEACSLTRRTVQRNIETLINTGYIIKKARWSHLHEQLSNDYIFNLSYTEEELATQNNNKLEITNYINLQYPKVEFAKIDYLKTLYNVKLSAREKMILSYFAHKANKNGLTYNTVEHMCRQVNCCLRTFFKAFKQLIKANIIKVQYIVKNGTEIVVVSLSKECLIAYEMIKEASQRVQTLAPVILGQGVNACYLGRAKAKRGIKELVLNGIRKIKEVKRKVMEKIEGVKTELSRFIWNKLTEKPM